MSADPPGKLRLPHPELVAVVEGIKRNVIGTRRAVVADIDLCYAVFRRDPDLAEVGEERWEIDACYDVEGTIYLRDDLVAFDERVADLTAYHEHVEIQHKVAGRAHAYAHRRAYVEELLAARQVFGEAAEIERYLRWLIGGYPAWKGLDPEVVAADLAGVLLSKRPRKGELLRVIEVHRL